MALVTFNENVDHYVKGDVVELDADEKKRIDAYALATYGKDFKAYSKGASKVDTSSGDETTVQSAQKTTGKPVEEKTASDEVVEVETPEANDAGSPEQSKPTEPATELPQVEDKPADDAKNTKK